MAKVLWFSRHQMSDEQCASLERKLGTISVHQVDRTVQSARELSAEIEDADIIAIVAPIGLQAEFLRLAGDKPVISAVSRRELVEDPNGGESQTVFVFERWERLLKVEVIKETFSD